MLASWLFIRPGPGWKGPVGFGLTVFLCLTPWSVRNVLVSGQWIWIQRGAIELANVMSTSPESTGVESAAYKLWEAQTLEEWRSLPDNARVGYLRSRLAEFIPSHPDYYAKALSSKVVDLWHPIPRSVRAEGPGRTKGIILWGSYGLLIPFFFLGLWSLRKQPRVTIVILGYVLCNLAIGIIGTTGFRIRLQIHFLFLCVAGLGLSRAFQARSERSAG